MAQSLNTGFGAGVGLLDWGAVRTAVAGFETVCEE